jgi:hypothetical protein
MDYETILADARQYPHDADYHALRMALTRSPAYQPYAHDGSTLTALGEALRAGDLDTAVEAVAVLLDANYLDIEAHMAADYVHTQRQEPDQAHYHRTFARGLIDSIAQSGDGRHFDTAFIVIATAEEYTLMRVMGLRPQGQSLVEHQGHWFDLLDARHPASGDPLKVYFNIDLPQGWLVDHMGA